MNSSTIFYASSFINFLFHWNRCLRQFWANIAGRKFFFSFSSFDPSQVGMLCLPCSSHPNTADFQWSLKPIFILAQLIGFAMTETSRVQNKRIKCKIVHTTVFLVGCTALIINSYKILKFTPKFYTPQELNLQIDTTTKMSHFLIKDLIFLLLYGIYVTQMIAHLVLFILCHFTEKWRNMWSALKKIRNDFGLSRKFHQKVRRKCYIGLLLLLLVNF